MGSTESSTVVTTVVDAIISDIDEGRLQPGDRLSDARFAQQLGVSRTPVREAFQRLRELGIIEASASRFTRVTLVSPRETADTLVVWTALFDALLDEVVPTAPPELLERMRAHHEGFVEAARALDVQRIASTNVSFFNAATGYSANPRLQAMLIASIQLVRLGGLRLRGPLDFATIVRSQAMLLSAMKSHDVAQAHASVALLRALRVPGSESSGAPAAGA